MDFTTLFNSLPEIQVVISPEYKILAVTDAFLQVSQRTREQVLGKHLLLEAFPGQDVAYEENPVKKCLDRTLETKKTVLLDVIRYDIPLPVAEGGGFEIRYWEVTQTPLLDAGGEVTCLVQKSTDVTERELAKQALNESEQKFRFMAEAMPQLIFTTDKQGNLTYFNKRWEEYTGIALEELLRDGWQKMIHPDDMESTTAKWQTAFQGGTAMQAELRKRDRDGAYRWHLCRSIPMKDDEGNITMWVGSSTDIHDTRKMVQELLETNEQMAQLSDQVQLAFEKAESERKTLENLIMEAPAMFVLLEGPEHRFKLLNDQYQQLYPGRDLVGLPLAEALPDIEAQGFIKLLDQVYQTGETFIAEGVPIRLPIEGTEQLEDRYFNFSYQATYEAGGVSGILAFGYDISNEVIYKQKLQELSNS